MLITINFNEQLPNDFLEVNCTSRSKDKWRELSPFMNRPIRSVDGLLAQNLENLWQFSKVYREHVNEQGDITDEFYKWRENGFSDTFAHRYPMYRGAVPLFSLWGDDRLDYIQARKQIYFPKYEENIIYTQIYKDLKKLYKQGCDIAIRDFDVYRFDLLNITIDEVIDNPKRKAGHGFVLYKMLIDNK